MEKWLGFFRTATGRKSYLLTISSAGPLPIYIFCAHIESYSEYTFTALELNDYALSVHRFEMD